MQIHKARFCLKGSYDFLLFQVIPCDYTSSGTDRVAFILRWEYEISGSHEGTDGSGYVSWGCDSEEEIEETSKEEVALGVPFAAEKFASESEGSALDHDWLAYFGGLVAGYFGVGAYCYFLAGVIPAGHLDCSKILYFPVVFHDDFFLIEAPDRDLSLFGGLADEADEVAIGIKFYEAGLTQS